MRKSYILFLLLSIQIHLFGQVSHIKFDHITLENGLSQSSIYSIVQDNKGFMWFATLDGLNKYDGYNIKIYRNILRDSTSISDNVLNVLYVDKEEYGGALWIGTRGAGLCKYNIINENFSSFSNNNNNISINDNNVKAICGEKDFLWIGTENGLNKFDRKTKEFKYFKNTDNQQYIESEISFIIDNKSNLFIGTKNGLNIFNKKTEEFSNILFTSSKSGGNNLNSLNSGIISKDGYLYLGTNEGLIKFNIENQNYSVYKSEINSHNSLNSNIITSIIEDKDGILWIGTMEGGLNRFDKTNETFQYFKHDASQPTSLQTDNVLTLYQDKANILWVGNSLGGINKWNRAAENLSLFRHNPYNPYSLSSNQVRNVYEDSKGKIWIGTVQGGLNQFIKEENKFQHYINNPHDKNSLSNNHVRAIFEDSKGRYWIGTDGGGLNQFFPETKKFKTFDYNPENVNSISNNNIWRIVEDKKGRLWIATFGGGVNIFYPDENRFENFKHQSNDSKSLSNNNVTTIYIDSSDEIWIGTFGGGLNKWNEKSKTFTSYQFNPSDTNSLGNNRIYVIVEDSKKRLWIGTKGSFSYFDKKKNNFINYDEKNNLPNDNIMGIIEDNSANIWISTNKGISKFNPDTKKVRNYDIRDGLQSNEFLVGAFCKTKSGILIFGGINGFNVFDPNKMKDNLNKPSVVITGFKISNQDIEFDTTISEKKLINLTYKQNDISFDFVALDYIFPEKNQYKYKLVGYDKDWIYSKYQRQAKYTNLSPGKYIFKVIGSNNDEIWNNEGTSIQVIIEPALWQRLWFKISSALIIISLIFLWFYLRIRRIKKQNEILEKQVELRTAEVVAQKEQIEEHLHEIEEQKREITDSIIYAKRIQTAALPVSEYINQIAPEHFVLFKPKDIVSGDFYWVGEKNEKIIIAAADCTGHGVPGAFMSMLGISFLNKIVNEKGFVEPDVILNRLRNNVIQALKQHAKEDEPNDGMDIALCTIDYKKMKLQFAGSNNPLYIIRNNKKVEVIKGDKMPIAFHDNMNKFKLTEIDIKKGDVFYIFSDGYADQFGGPRYRKFMYKPFRELLQQISEKPMEEQKDILNTKIEEWKGSTNQVDDIIVFGLRI
ncbi:MAG: SpoIIE family protein phosphatase [Bacteroidales bacterium]|nr:SpoIIE family protein phosphatase [Bacteroidales bacterium]MBN2758558.1 SpoIIE family protein phosphatase [Bacteroidales bacterium]